MVEISVDSHQNQCIIHFTVKQLSIMTYKLFIDDERNPVTNDWKIARSSQEAIQYLQLFGCPVEIAFDHDLGGDDTSMHFCRALYDYLDATEQAFPEGFTYSIHSQNPVGRENIKSYMQSLENYLVSR